jgi:hypothetical protein
MIDRSHARFAMPAPTKGGAAALVLSPNTERDGCRPESRLPSGQAVDAA